MDMNAAFIFAKVVEAKGFSSAARMLGVPKTTVSKKVSELETFLGVRLLKRTTRAIATTEAGQRFYNHCAEAIRAMSEAEREAISQQDQLRGLLKVAAASSALLPIILPAINSFLVSFPLVNINLSTHIFQNQTSVTSLSESFDVLIKVDHALDLKKYSFVGYCRNGSLCQF